MTLRVHGAQYAVCRLAPDAPVPVWANCGGFSSVTRTSSELSVVVYQDSVPSDVEAVPGWTLFEVVGPLDFDEVGILSCLIQPLAAANIPILAIATFDTDYLLSQHARKARQVLQAGRTHY